MASVTALAVRFFDLAVEMQDISAAGAFVEVVDVLGDQREVGRLHFELRNGVMRGVGRCAQDGSAAPFMPSPDESRVARERVGVASSKASYCSQNPFCLSLNLGIPLSAEGA